MRNKLTVLAVAALLTFGVGGVVATTMDHATPTGELPANHTVDVAPPEEVSEEQVTRAVATAWGADDVRSVVADGDGVHFEVWDSQLDDETVHVSVAPLNDPDDTRVVADVDLANGTVTSVEEVVTLDATNAVAIDGDEYDVDLVNDTETEATRLTADQSTEIEVNESTADHGDDGTITFEIETETESDDRGDGTSDGQSTTESE